MDATVWLFKTDDARKREAADEFEAGTLRVAALPGVASPFEGGTIIDFAAWVERASPGVSPEAAEAYRPYYDACVALGNIRAGDLVAVPKMPDWDHLATARVARDCAAGADRVELVRSSIRYRAYEAAAPNLRKAFMAYPAWVSRIEDANLARELREAAGVRRVRAAATRAVKLSQAALRKACEAVCQALDPVDMDAAAFLEYLGSRRYECSIARGNATMTGADSLSRGYPAPAAEFAERVGSASPCFEFELGLWRDMDAKALYNLDAPFLPVGGDGGEGCWLVHADTGAIHFADQWVDDGAGIKPVFSSFGEMLKFALAIRTLQEEQLIPAGVSELCDLDAAGWAAVRKTLRAHFPLMDNRGSRFLPD